MVIRSFLAFELPDNIRDEVRRISNKIRKTGLSAGWVRPENIHLTVIFMGNLDEKDIPSVISGIDSVAEQFGPFEISLKGPGLFPNIRRPRVIWLGLGGDIKGLENMRNELQIPLEPLGVEQERRSFRPHLTIGRFRKAVKNSNILNKIIDDYSDISGPAETLNELIMFKSELKPGGAIYTKIHSRSLRSV